METPTPTETAAPVETVAPVVYDPQPHATTVEQVLTSIHDQISVFLLFTSVVEVIVLVALGALVVGVLRARG
jgi:hypothetical protein